MTFMLGFVIGYFAHKLFSWVDSEIEKNICSEKVFRTNCPKGQPITFEDWKKQNGIF